MLCFLLRQALCQEIHSKITVVDEERYNIEAKVMHNSREVGEEAISLKNSPSGTHPLWAELKLYM